MPINPVGNQPVAQVYQNPILTPAKMKAALAKPGVMDFIAKNPLLKKNPGLVKDALRLMELKQRMMRLRGKKGSKRAIRSRRRRLQRRFSKIAQRFTSRLRRAMNRRHTQRTQNTKGADMAFLSDKSLSLDEKIERFMAALIKRSEKKIEEMMKQHAGEGTSEKKGGGFFKTIGKIFKGLAGGVATALGGPLAGMATNAVIGAVEKGASSKSSGTDGKPSEADKQLLMSKIQKEQGFVTNALNFFSQYYSNQKKLNDNIIRNMA